VAEKKFEGEKADLVSRPTSLFPGEACGLLTGQSKISAETYQDSLTVTLKSDRKRGTNDGGTPSELMRTKGEPGRPLSNGLPVKDLGEDKTERVLRARPGQKKITSIDRGS